MYLEEEIRREAVVRDVGGSARFLELTALESGPEAGPLLSSTRGRHVSPGVERYLERFPRENIRIYWYEEAWLQPAHLLEDLFGFLGVGSTFHPDTSYKASRAASTAIPRTQL